MVMSQQSITDGSGGFGIPQTGGGGGRGGDPIGSEATYYLAMKMKTFYWRRGTRPCALLDLLLDGMH